MSHLNSARSAVSSCSKCCRCYLRRMQPDLVRNNSRRRTVTNPQLFALRINRSSSSSSSKMYPTIHDDDNPFDILGIPKTSSYEVVKRRFVELALKYHPDVANNNKKTKNDDECENNDNSDNNSNETSGISNKTSTDIKYKNRETNMENFVRLRKAFERIRENDDGTTRLSGDSDYSSWSDDEFLAWFYEETQDDVMFKMDVKTRKEVIDVVKTDQSPGGLDKGGMWELARSMAQEEEYLLQKKNREGSMNSNNIPFKGIDSGQTQQPKIRRRRRK